jgi:hypothetical protein
LGLAEEIRAVMVLIRNGKLGDAGATELVLAAIARRIEDVGVERVGREIREAWHG